MAAGHGSNAKVARVWAVLGAIATALLLPYALALMPTATSLAHRAKLPVGLLHFAVDIILYVLGWIVAYEIPGPGTAARDGRDFPDPYAGLDGGTAAADGETCSRSGSSWQRF